jgi:hypothetical protein
MWAVVVGFYGGSGVLGKHVLFDSSQNRQLRGWYSIPSTFFRMSMGIPLT